MNTCNCKGQGSPSGQNDGGKHLFRDCTKKKKEEGKSPSQATNVATLIADDDESEEGKLARYSAFFDRGLDLARGVVHGGITMRLLLGDLTNSQFALPRCSVMSGR